MSKKVSDLEKKDRGNLRDHVEAASDSMGLDSWDTPATGMTNERRNRVKEILGLCWDCSNLSLVEFELTGFMASCAWLDMRLTGRNKPTQCTRYQKRGQMSLDDALGMAWIIDPGGKKIGF